MYPLFTRWVYFLMNFLLLYDDGGLLGNLQDRCKDIERILLEVAENCDKSVGNVQVQDPQSTHLHLLIESRKAARRAGAKQDV